MEYYSAIKRRKYCHFDNMDETGDIMLQEISQREKDKYNVVSNVVSLVCVSKKKSKQTTVAREWGWGGQVYMKGYNL